MPSDKDIVVESKDLVAIHASFHPNGHVCRTCATLRALANEVERLRPVVNAAVEWRRVGYERKDAFSYRIDPLLDAIDIYDVGQRRPCEEL